MIDRPPWQTAAAVAAALLLLLAGLRWLDRTRGGEEAQVALAGPQAAGMGDRSAGSDPTAPGYRSADGDRDGARGSPMARRTVFVHVAGAVRRPGVYALPVGARADLAVERAGGPARRADLAAVNLAAPLEDGQQLLVPVRGAAGASGAGAAPAGAPGASRAPGSSAAPGPPAAAAPVGPQLSLASASAAQLEELDGIGPALAARIIAYRDQHGGFRSIEELREVDGIGDKRLESLRRAVRP